MSDIFISYKREDRTIARRLADALEERGWSVWWDPKLRAGERFDEVIEAALQSTKCVIVLWSQLSVRSQYVRDEANYALDDRKLVPVAIETVVLPFRFRGLHTPQLLNWDGDTTSPEFRKLIDDLANTLGRPPIEVHREGVHAAEEETQQGVAQSAVPPRAEHDAKPQEARTPTAPLQEPKKEGSLRQAFRRLLFSRAVKLVVIGVLTVALGVWGVPEWQTREVVESPSHAVKAEGRNAHEQQASAQEGVENQEARSQVPMPGTIFQDSLQDDSQGPEMIVIPAGDFTMGSPQSEKDRAEDEGPQHRVTLAEPFALGRYEVTFDEYDRFARATGRALPGDMGWGRGDRPVIKVSWEDATAYTVWLSEETGKRYRLPTEAEWEYAARAETTTARFWGDEPSDACRYANVYDTTGEREAKAKYGFDWAPHDCDDGFVETAPVGNFQANAFGLKDMLGNVWEWVQDCWHGSYTGAPTDGSAWLEGNGGACGLRVLRGGSWNHEPRYVRSATRTRTTPESRTNNLGFRLAQDL